MRKKTSEASNKLDSRHYKRSNHNPDASFLRQSTRLLRHETRNTPTNLRPTQAALVDRFQRRGEDGENEEGEGTYSLAQGTLQKHLRLDSAAAAAVMLLPDPTAPHEFGSLFNVLNRYILYCHTIYEVEY